MFMAESEEKRYLFDKTRFEHQQFRQELDEV